MKRITRSLALLMLSAFSFCDATDNMPCETELKIMKLKQRIEKLEQERDHVNAQRVTWLCRVTNDYDEEFTGSGRTKTEALAEAYKPCRNKCTPITYFEGN